MPVTYPPPSSANSPNVGSFTLKIGVQELLYSKLASGGAKSPFGLPPQASNYRGRLVLQAVGHDGSLTAATISLEVSLDGGTTFGALQNLANFSASPAVISAYTGVSILNPTEFDVSGLGGNGKLRLNFTTFTLNTATSMDVYAQIG